MSPPRLTPQEPSPDAPQGAAPKAERRPASGNRPSSFSACRLTGLLQEGLKKKISEGRKETGLGSHSGHAGIPLVKWEIG